MGKKERIIKARIAEYYKEPNQFGYDENPLSEVDMEIIDDSPEEKMNQEIFDFTYHVRNMLVEYADMQALDLCEYLDLENLENFIRHTLESTYETEPSSRLKTVTERPVKIVPPIPVPIPELSKKNKKRFGTWENFNKYWSDYYKAEFNKKADARTIILRSIIIPWALRIKLDWPNRMLRLQEEKRLQEEEMMRQKLKKWEEDDKKTILFAMKNCRKN